MASWGGYYDGSTVPTSASPAWTLGASGAATTEASTGGVFRLQMPDSLARYYYRDNSASSHPFAMGTARVKLATLGGSGTNVENNVYFSIRVAGKFRCSVGILSGTSLKVTCLDSSGVAQTQTITVPSTTDDFHDLRIVYDESSGSAVTKVYWDGRLVHTYSGGHYTSETNTRVLFGDATSSTYGGGMDASWDAVWWYFGDSTDLSTISQVTKTLDGTVTKDTRSTSQYAYPSYTTAGSQKWSNNIAGDHQTATVVSNETKLTHVSGAASSYQQYWRTVVDESGITGGPYLLLGDFNLAFDLHPVQSSGASNSLTITFTDTSGTTVYTLTIPNNNSGTSAFKDSGGTTRMSVAKGVADGTTRRVILYRVGNTFGGSIDGTAFTPWTDSGGSNAILRLRLDIPAGSGGTDSDVRLGEFNIAGDTDLRVRAVPTGGSVRLFDLAGNTLASATETSGTAILDLRGMNVPIFGVLRVYSDSYTTQVGWLPLHGDRPGTEVQYGTLPYVVIGTEFQKLYATSQANTNNGVVYSGDLAYGVTMGPDNEVVAFKTDMVAKTSETYKVTAPLAVPDSHGPLAMVADSSGYLHMIYGGYMPTVTLKYRKSNTPYGWNDWGSEQSITGTEGFDCGLMITSDDKLHVPGVKWNGSFVRDKLVYISKTSGGSWSSVTTLANNYTGYEFYFSDCQVGLDNSVNFTYFTLKSDFTIYKQSGVMRSTDGGSTWKGFGTSAFSIPLAMASDGTVTGGQAIYTGTDAYIARFAVDSSGIAHIAQARTGTNNVYYYKASGSGIAATSYTFSGANTGLSVQVYGDDTVAFVGAVVAQPNTITRWYSKDAGATIIGPEALVQDANTSSSSEPNNPRWYWTKATRVGGTGVVRAVWQSRNNYTNPTYNITQEGRASLFLADIPALPVDPALRGSATFAGRAAGSTQTDTALRGSATFNGRAAANTQTDEAQRGSATFAGRAASDSLGGATDTATRGGAPTLVTDPLADRVLIGVSE